VIGTIIETAESFDDEMKMTDKCTFSEGSNKKKLPVRTRVSIGKCLIIQDQSGPIGARLKEFCCMLCIKHLHSSTGEREREEIKKWQAMHTAAGKNRNHPRHLIANSWKYREHYFYSFLTVS
jgi:hypothetical protein